MEFTGLSDAELRQLVQEDGDAAPGVREELELRGLVEGDESPAPAAREELERRHYRAVRAFAGVVSPAAGGRLASQAWEQALRPLDEDITGAMRPRSLAAVLRTAADWSRTDRREALAPELLRWFDEGVVEPPTVAEPALLPESGGDESPGAARLAQHRRASVTTRAFERLAARSQTVLWHHNVERDGSGTIDLLLGDEAEDVALLDRRARRELYNTYVALHQDETVDDACRRLHRMLLAYAEQTSMNTPGDLVAHLDTCAHCARAVDDLERMRFEFGSVLAESLLPWGGSNYALSASHAVGATAAAETDGEAAGAATAGTLAEAVGAVGAVGVAGAGAGTASGSGAGSGSGSGVRFGFGFGARPGGGAGAGSGLRGASGAARAWGAYKAAGPVRRAVGLLDGMRARARRTPWLVALVNREHGLHTRPLVLSAALVGLCSIAVAVVFTGGLGGGGENSGAPGPGRTGSAPPSVQPGEEPTATATITAPPGDGQGYEPPPPVKDAALEWLFDDEVDDGVTEDTSDNGYVGTLIGDEPPEQVEDGKLEFDDELEQAVEADAYVVDTTHSYSVSARVKLDDTDDYRTVVSQDASQISGFAVQYDPEADRWEMIVPEEDEEDADLVQAAGEPGPATDTWTYLTGVYDADAQRIRLYVDGELADEATVGGDRDDEDDGSDEGSASTTTTTSGGGSSTTTTTTTTSGGGDGEDGQDGQDGDGWGGAGGGWGGGGPGGGDWGGGGGGWGGPGRYFAGQSAPAYYEPVDAQGYFAVGRGLNGQEFRGFNGMIDEVRAFKRALTPEEAAKLAGR